MKGYLCFCQKNLLKPKKVRYLCTPFGSQEATFDFLFAVLFDTHGHGATVAYGSPKPLIWVRILVPVLIFLMQKLILFSKFDFCIFNLQYFL
jgi:hypothetical protein